MTIWAPQKQVLKEYMGQGRSLRSCKDSWWKFQASESYLTIFILPWQLFKKLCHACAPLPRVRLFHHTKEATWIWTVRRMPLHYSRILPCYLLGFTLRSGTGASICIVRLRRISTQPRSDLPSLTLEEIHTNLKQHRHNENQKKKDEEKTTISEANLSRARDLPAVLTRRERVNGKERLETMAIAIEVTAEAGMKRCPERSRERMHPTVWSTESSRREIRYSRNCEAEKGRRGEGRVWKQEGNSWRWRGGRQWGASEKERVMKKLDKKTNISLVTLVFF